ncbi:MAG TPA: hypothetical protein VK141_05615, partial [Nitrosomonas sp.]|nr:hypothetical protein [Nitrosomonas sp.]
MNLPQLASNKHFKTATVFAAILIAVYTIINVFVIGGDEFIIEIGNYITVPLAILTILISIMLWKQVSGNTNSGFLWSHMIAGWACWTIAEILWAVFAYLSQDMPYPSWADFFWVLGYIPMGMGLAARVRSLPAKPTTNQLAVIWGVSIATIIFTAIFVLQPIVLNNDPTKLVESILNLLFPILDLVLLVIVLYLFFAYEQGAYGFGWRLILVGFITHQVANLLFSYASTAELYYPDGKATLLSTLGVDVPYNVSYVFWMLGIYLLSVLLKEHRAFSVIRDFKLVPNAHFLVFTKNDGTIIDISHNFYSFFTLENVKGKTLDSVLEFAQNEGHTRKENIRAGKTLNDQLVHLKSPSGASQDGLLCGLAIFTQGEYAGANYMIRTYVENDHSLDTKLTESEKSVIRHFVIHNISNESNEIRQLLLDYYLTYFKSLFNMAFHEGGATMSQLLLDELQHTAKLYGWQINLNPQTILDGNLYSLDV